MDTGCGIAAEDLSRLFDPFFTTKQGGTGLGLSLCHKIVSAHGGEIEVKNRETGGTEFKVIIPQHGGEA
jgi:signal transduction histidine kinase